MARIEVVLIYSFEIGGDKQDKFLLQRTGTATTERIECGRKRNYMEQWLVNDVSVVARQDKANRFLASILGSLFLSKVQKMAVQHIHSCTCGRVEKW